MHVADHGRGVGTAARNDVLDRVQVSRLDGLHNVLKPLFVGRPCVCPEPAMANDRFLGRRKRRRACLSCRTARIASWNGPLPLVPGS